MFRTSRTAAALFAALTILLTSPDVASTQTAGGQPALTMELARSAVDAAEAEARRNGWNVTIVVVDTAGVPVYLRRLSGASPRSYDFAMGKARTSAASGLSTTDYAARAAAGSIRQVPDPVTIEGGFPIRIGDTVVGAIAVSGVRPDQDGQVARAGLDAIRP